MMQVCFFLPKIAVVSGLRIVSATTADLAAKARILFLEYAASLDVDLCFQDFDRELATLPGDYSAPHGALLIAFLNDEIAGCAALRRLDAETCEMKRLYVRSAFRGKGIGHALALSIVAVAREIGYTRIRLDTLPNMIEAQGLYAAMGFRDIGAYRANPVPGSRFLELVLTEDVRSSVRGQ